MFGMHIDSALRTLRRGLFLSLIAIAGFFALQADHSFAANDGYVLDAGDILQFDFLDDEELPVQLTVSTEGYVQVPLLGPQLVGGSTMEEALVALKNKFVEKGLLVDPRITFSVSTWRPIFILGDVRSPGSYPFQANMTAEMGEGMAGGLPAATSTTEERVLAKARLQAEIVQSSTEIAKEAVLSAKNSAQLANRVSITPDDIPATVRNIVDMALFEQLKAGEEDVLKAELSSFKAESKLIDESIVEAERQLGILDELIDNQKRSIKLSEDSLKRGNELMKKGLKTVNDIDDLRRQVAADEARLLSALSAISASKRAVSTLNRDRAQLENTRVKDATRARQDHQANINRLVAQRAGLEEQLLLIANLSIQEASEVKTVEITYKIRRRGTEGNQSIAAAPDTPLHPGDVLFVSINRPGHAPAATTVGQAQSNSGTTQ
jgi:protein involved in polysaccharide export with SLBB domain